jgi:hypothetical protein
VKKILLAILACLVLTGCEQSYELTKEKSVYIDAFVKSFVAFNTDKQEGNVVVPVVPAKYKRSQCPECKSTGKVRTGDGILVIDCTACEPDAKRFVDKAGKSWWGYDGESFWDNEQLMGEPRVWPKAKPAAKVQTSSTQSQTFSSGAYCASCSGGSAGFSRRR